MESHFNISKYESDVNIDFIEGRAGLTRPQVIENAV
jgi:hypothetical protein